MKLSEMSTDTAREVLCNLAVPLGALAENPGNPRAIARGNRQGREARVR